MVQTYYLNLGSQLPEDLNIDIVKTIASREWDWINKSGMGNCFHYKFFCTI